MTIEEELESVKTTNQELADRVNQLESINISLVDQKKELKQKLEDGFSDEDMKKELTNYKNQLELVESDKNEADAQHNKEMSKLSMMGMLRDLNVKGQSKEALEKIAEMALDGAEYKDGAIRYLNEDSTTRFNEDTKKDFSIMDKVNEIKDSGNSFYFAQATGGGATDAPTAPTKAGIGDIIDAGLTY